MEQSKKNCCEMLHQRGYVVEEQFDSLVSFKATKQSELLICVYFHSLPKLNKKYIAKYISSMEAENCSHSIIIYTETITTMMVKALSTTVGAKIELFKMKELSFNLTKHRLQPKRFTCLTEEETRIFKEQFGIKIPVLKSNDMVCRFFNYNRGSIIEIEKKNGLIDYRIVK